MVVAKVNGNMFRILDFYSRDRSTPHEDEWYGGAQSLTGAVGRVINGVTYVRFRRPLRTNDSFDHDIVSGDFLVVWAHGRPDSCSDFYQPLELKYHGPSNRGLFLMNFLEKDTTSAPPSMTTASAIATSAPTTSMSAPHRKGSFKNGNYEANWTFRNDRVDFSMSVSGENGWVGIGFSCTPQMPMSDIVVGTFPASGEGEVTDQWATRHSRPVVDTDQSQVFNKMSGTTNGRSWVSFSRSIESTDSMDVPLSGCDCGGYFLFAHGSLKADGRTHNHGTQQRWSMYTPWCEQEPTTSPPCVEPMNTIERESSLPIIISWKCVDGGDGVVFNVRVNSVNAWMAVGFSMNNRMPMTDTVVGTVSMNGMFTVSDRYIGPYKALLGPDSDQSQVTEKSGGVDDGWSWVSFRRSIATTDSMDFSLDEEIYLLFAWGTGNPRYHGRNRFVYEKKVMLNQCVCGK